MIHLSHLLHDFLPRFQVINHLISVEELRGPEQKKTACYDIDVEVDDNLKAQMNSFLLSTASQQEIQGLDNKIHETVETINSMKTQREFFLSFAKDPQLFINKWLMSQSRGTILKLFVASPQLSHVQFCDLLRFEDDDRRGRKSRGRAPHRLLLPTLGAGGRLPLLLSEDPTQEGRA